MSAPFKHEGSHWDMTLTCAGSARKVVAAFLVWFVMFEAMCVDGVTIEMTGCFWALFKHVRNTASTMGIPSLKSLLTLDTDSICDRFNITSSVFHSYRILLISLRRFPFLRRSSRQNIDQACTTEMRQMNGNRSSIVMTYYWRFYSTCYEEHCEVARESELS